MFHPRQILPKSDLKFLSCFETGPTFANVIEKNKNLFLSEDQNVEKVIRLFSLHTSCFCVMWGKNRNIKEPTDLSIDWRSDP